MFKAPHPGTYLYHCHETSVLHVQAGMYGVIIVRPNSADTMTWDNGYSFHSERTWLMSEIDTNWHHDTIINHTYDSTAMTHLVLDYRPQHFLINGKSEHQLVGNVELFASLGEQVYLRLANIGNYGNRMILPSVLNAQQVSSDGRPLPNTVLSDTIEILPGERYGVLLDCDAHFQGTGVVEYFNLNTGQVENTQNIAVTVDGYVGIPEYPEQPKMFPNPATNQLMIALPESIQEMASVTIENMPGSRVLEQKFPINL
jgi:FtsP/CotA-like multicopper oxidase with cupredoxin domain